MTSQLILDYVNCFQRCFLPLSLTEVTGRVCLFREFLLAAHPGLHCLAPGPFAPLCVPAPCGPSWAAAWPARVQLFIFQKEECRACC